jgi:hypothetical protein
MEQLIRELNDPANQGIPGRINDVQWQLQRLQRDESAWQGGLDLLQNPDPLVQFYGALTLTIKINADWSVLTSLRSGILNTSRDKDKVGKNTEARDSLLEALVSSYVRLTLLDTQAFVLQKLASTLATLYQRLHAQWLSPVRHVLGAVLQAQYLSADQVPPMYELVQVCPRLPEQQIGNVLRFAVTLAEDTSSRSLGGANQHSAVEAGETLELLQHILRGLLLPGRDVVLSVGPSSTPSDHTALARLALQALPLWTSILKSQETHADKETINAANSHALLCVTATLELLNDRSLTEPALQALVLIQTLCPRLLSKADPDFARTFASSDLTKAIVNDLLSGDFSTEGMALIELLDAIMLQVDVTSSSYVRSGRYAELMTIVSALLGCEGIAMVEDQVCQMMLETINNIVEGHTDWDPDPEAEDYLRQYVGQACAACLEKAKLPWEEMSADSRTWDKDDLAKFQEFRLDVHDFLQSAFGVIGVELIRAIVNGMAQNVSPERLGWRDFEGTLYCLIAFADTMTSEPEVYDLQIASVLDSPYFQLVLQGQDVPDVARKTCIRFVADFTSYFQRHPNIMQILNFLFSSLHLSATASTASRAIYALCDSQRSAFVEALPSFISSLQTIEDLQGMDRHRIYGAVAAIIQSLKQESDKIKPLSDVLELLARDMAKGESDASSEDDLVQRNTDFLQTLSAIGRGLRAPDDVPIDSERPDSGDAAFWTEGPGSEVQYMILRLYQSVIVDVGDKVSSEFVEACCDFVRSGFTESHPSPYKFATESSVDIVIGNILVSSPNIDAVMGTASSLLAATPRMEVQTQLPRVLQPILAGMQSLMSDSDRLQKIRESSFPSASMDFVSRLLPRWGKMFLEFDGSGEAFGLCFEMGLVVMSQPDTLPRRAAAQLFGAFVDLNKSGKVTGIAASNLQPIGQQYHPRIVALILHLIGGECARSELDVLSEQIRRYMQTLPLVFKVIAREAVKNESQVLTEKALKSTSIDQRTRMLAQIDALRGARKTNEVVKEFWLSCRGDEFGYIA